jgi:DNA-binding GntR family transcriptional regulator
MQLVGERALVLQTSRSLTVPRRSVAQYLELHRIRLELEGLAAAEAASHVTPRDTAALEKLHARYAKSDAAGLADAVPQNWHFHAQVFQCAVMPELFNMIQDLWLRTGPLLTYQYPHAPPVYPGRHRHLDVIDRLRERDGPGVRAAIQADTIEGGAALLQLLMDLDGGRVGETTLSQPLGAFTPAVLAGTKFSASGAVPPGPGPGSGRAPPAGSAT